MGEQIHRAWVPMATELREDLALHATLIPPTLLCQVWPCTHLDEPFCTMLLVIRSPCPQSKITITACSVFFFSPATMASSQSQQDPLALLWPWSPTV